MRTRHQRGFTLTEILVVIGIIVILAGILLPVVMTAVRSGERTRLAADLQAIAVALDQYKSEHGDYPRVLGDPSDPDYMTGAQILCRALIAPGPAVEPSGDDLVADGADGPGFRVRGTQGRVYGPYLRSEQFRLRRPSDLTNAAPDPEKHNLVLIDKNDNPILYFPARSGKLNLNIDHSYLEEADDAMYDARDNLEQFRHDAEGNNTNALLRLRVMLGDYDLDANYKVDDLSFPATNLPYVLWSAGPDGKFGPASVAAGDAAANRRAVEDCDDVTNFNVNP